MSEPSDGELAFRMDEVLNDPEKLLATVYRATCNPTFPMLLCDFISAVYKDNKSDIAQFTRAIRWEIEDRVQHEIMQGKL